MPTAKYDTYKVYNLFINIEKRIVIFFFFHCFILFIQVIFIFVHISQVSVTLNANC